MKQTILILALISLSSTFIAQEIPNGNFETWGMYNTWNYEPESWQTNNSQLLELVSRDTAAYEGDYAMQVTGIPLNEPVGFGQTGMAINTIPDNLSFYVKTEAIGFPFFQVACKFYYQGNTVEEQSWNTTETISDWTYQEFLFNNTGSAVDSVSIRVEAVMGDFVEADGWVSVDKFEFSGVNSVEENDSNAFLVYPNPTQNTLYFQGDLDSDTELFIYNMAGQLILKTKYKKSINISSLSSGTYFILWENQEGNNGSLEFIKE